MGKMTDVLNKVQESRQPCQDQKIPDFFYINDNQQTYPRKVVMAMVVIVAAGALGAVLMSNEIYNLERTVKMQEGRFNDLTVFLNNTKGLSDNQIQYFNFRLKNEAEDRKIQINKLALIDSEYYINLINSIHANTFRINSLEKYIKNSASDIQTKDLPYSPKDH